MSDEGGFPIPALGETLARFRTRPAAWGALAVNLVPIAGVLFFGWNAAALMILYWLENVIIGVFNALKIIASGLAHGRTGMMASAFLVPFFAFHYGIFCLVHGIFVFVLFGKGLSNPHTLDNISGPLDMPVLVRALIKAEPSVAAGLAAIVIWQAIQFVVFYLGMGAYKRIDPFSRMFAPYGRIVILHITIMGAALIVLALGQPLIGVVILALLKTAFDIAGETRAEQDKIRENWDRFEALARDGFKQTPGSTPRE